MIDADGWDVTATITLDDYLDAVAIDPGGRTVYATNHETNTVSVIDADTRTLIATIDDVGGEPSGVAVDPVTHAVYTTNARHESVSVITCV